jgi:hypothetical protein
MSAVYDEGEGRRLFGTWALGMSGSFPAQGKSATVLSLTLRQEVRDTTGDIDDVGLVLLQSASLRFRRAVGYNALLSLFGIYDRTDLLEAELTQPTEEYLRTGGHFSWTPWRYLMLTARYSYRRRLTDLAEGDSSDRDYQRATLVLSTGAWLF